MGFRLTTWNVNGIRNPFGHPPWRDQRTFAAMFDILETDIAVFQETKIQRKDLRDDMVLVPGWDCYWSLPRHKKGYSGVVIYTRQSKCAPIRAEEGITGILCPPNSSTSFRDLEIDRQIGGYPTALQLERSNVDAATLDSEGRCVILEFPAFVLLGVYSPANRDETRDDFRIGFLNLLDARIRNLIASGKRVILTGDLNISPALLDTANPDASLRKNGVTAEEWISTPSRRILNQLLEGGNVEGERDHGRERPVLWDLCRAFHPSRTGMFTCWEQKVNARPGNHGSRIDYVLCSASMKDWFTDSNIQEGLMGSDHCPVYATFKDRVTVDGADVSLLDLMNPVGMYRDGQRQREYSPKDTLLLSGKLIPEFDGRRSIRDMFSRKQSSPASLQVVSTIPTYEEWSITKDATDLVIGSSLSNSATIRPVESVKTSPSGLNGTTNVKKRPLPDASTRLLKRSKSGSSSTPAVAVRKGQQSLKGFFKSQQPLAKISTSDEPERDGAPKSADKKHAQSPKSPELAANAMEPITNSSNGKVALSNDLGCDTQTSTSTSTQSPSRLNGSASSSTTTLTCPGNPMQTLPQVHDQVASAQSWSKLFAKPVAPRCEGHDEPCITLLTKKSGMNCGRSFWMCSRPLGPSGAKEKNTQWRCQTFIWCSDWNSSSS